MAMRTKHIRLGTNVTPLVRRRPWQVARETVTLDHLSSGRIILGIGLGDTGESVGLDISFTHFGEVMDVRRRGQMLDEALDVIVGLWSGEPFSYDGQYYRVKEVTFLPRPVQAPRIPIWVGGGWPLKGPTRRAARWDGSCLYKHQVHHMTPDDVRDLKAFIRQHRGSVEGYDIVVGGSPRRADWEEERNHIQSLAEAGVTWWTEYIPPGIGGLDSVRTCIARGPLRID